MLSIGAGLVSRASVHCFTISFDLELVTQSLVLQFIDLQNGNDYSIYFEDCWEELKDSI